MNFQTILLFLIGFLVGSDEFLLGPILTPIGADLGVAPERVTLFIGAYALPLALLAPVFGALSDRLGRRAVLVPATLLFALGSLGTALAPGYEVALLTRVLTGVGAAGMLPVAFSSAADSGPGRIAANIAAVQAGLTCGIITAPVYGAAMTSLLGWHWAFAGLAIVAGASLLAIGQLPQRVAQDLAGSQPSRASVPWAQAAAAIVAMGFGLGGAIGIYALVGERLREVSDLGTGAVGLVYAGFGIMTLAGNLVMPRVIGRMRDGRQLMLWCMTGVLAAIVAIFGLELGLILFCGCMGLWAFLGGLGAPGLQSYLAGLSDSHRGVLMALGASAMNFGVAIWSAVAAMLFDRSAGLVALLAVVVIGIALIALYRPAQRQDAARAC